MLRGVSSWSGSMPSNIALIKYMGKSDATLNQAQNISLSYTLNHLRSEVTLELFSGSTDEWHPFEKDSLYPLRLSEKSQERFLKHLSRIKNVFACNTHFTVRSANNFPDDCGLASSASSFAALTKVAAEACAEITGKPQLSQQALAHLSRQGSGSSCRSFFEPWAVWNDQEVFAIDLPQQSLYHAVVIADAEKKAVSSSEAHLRVNSSLLFEGRPARAEKRFHALIKALRENAWETAQHLCWNEFWDMHALFETAITPFSYFTSTTFSILDFIKKNQASWKDIPLITLDAGPNVHLLFKEKEAHTQACDQLKNKFKVIA